MKALLVIDMQQGSFTEITPRYDTDGVILRINSLAAAFREKDDAVIFIQHDGTAQGDFLPGTFEWEILPGLVIAELDHRIAKTANDCFYHSQLAALLRRKRISELVITGCATDFCVDTTVKAALARDYDTTVIADGHTTADRTGIAAPQVIAHYNWIWENMLPTGGKLRVLPAEAYLAQEQ